MSYERNRGSVFLEDARILAQHSWPGQQFVLRVHAPRAARKAVPGTFAHIACDPSVPMRRPLSIMRVDADRGLARILVQAARARARAARPTAARRSHQRARADRPRLHRRPRAAAAARARRRRRHSADDLPRRAGARRRRAAAARAHGLGSPLPVRARGIAARCCRASAKPPVTRWRCSSNGACLRASPATPASPGAHRGYITDLARNALQR